MYILDDGGEVDLDLGNYERFMNIALRKENNITTGKIYQSVIQKVWNDDWIDAVMRKMCYVVSHEIGETRGLLGKDRSSCPPHLQ